MDNVAQFPQQESIPAQASAWIARLDRGDLSQREHAEFQQWINRSPQHREEIRRLCALWDDLNLLTELTTATPAPTIRRRRTCWIRSAVAVTATVVAVALSVVFVHLQSDPIDTAGFYAAGLGAQKTVELADGSIMQLNTDSHAKVEYSDATRSIRLLKGEAYFDVTSDPDRPFLVHAGTNAVRAVGTAFSVHLTQGDLEVLVTEGTVELSADVPSNSDAAPSTADAPAAKPITINAGHMATLTDRDKSLQTVTREEMHRKLSWREKMLAFSDAPLSEVIREFNRYTATTIVISDPGLSQIRIGGYFKAGETEALLGALESSFGIRVVRVDDKLVYLALADPVSPMPSAPSSD